MYVHAGEIRVGPIEKREQCEKHRIDFETARLVFYDPLHVAFIDSIEGGEARWHAIGMIEDTIMITVVHGDRVEGSDEVIRLIFGAPCGVSREELICRN
jgi:uncharacterized protein